MNDDSSPLIVSLAGRQWQLAPDAVCGTMVAATAAALPFAPPGCEGVVDCDGILVTQFAPVGDFASTPGDGRFAVRVNSVLGPVLVRVTAIGRPTAAMTAGVAALPDFMSFLNDWLCGCPGRLIPAAKRPDSPVPADIPADRPPLGAGAPGTLDFLIVRSRGTPVAVPAGPILRVERHGGVGPVRGSPTGEKMVALESGVVVGWSLGERLFADAAADSEGLAVVLNGGRETYALTVAAVESVCTLPVDSCYRYATALRVAYGLHHPAYGPIEIVTLADFLQYGSTPDLLELDNAIDAAADARFAAAADGGVAAAAEAGQLAVTAGGVGLILPLALCGEVINPDAGWRKLSGRRPGAVAVVDAGRLLGMTAEGCGRQNAAVMLAGSGGPAVAVQGATVARPATATPWQPLPVVPGLAGELFSAVRLETDSAGAPRCEFLVRDDVLSRRRNRTVRRWAADALSHWLLPC